MTLIGQKNIDMTKQPSLENGMMYGCSVGEYSQEVHGTHLLRRNILLFREVPYQQSESL